MNATGKVQIRKAYEAIAAHFNHTLRVEQAGMKILEAGDAALVIANTAVSASNMPATNRSATYVFKKHSSGDWLCQIDNSYGHELLLPENAYNPALNLVRFALWTLHDKIAQCQLVLR
jgi:ketosteroid isomerase-like protein